MRLDNAPGGESVTESFGSIVLRRKTVYGFPMTDMSLEAGLKKAGIRTADRHLFLCIGPDCCSTDVGEETWEYVKKRVRETGISAMRTKAACFRICSQGPWLAVYPEGIWYSRVSSERFERILQEHLLGGRPVHEWVTATNGQTAPLE